MSMAVMPPAHRTAGGNRKMGGTRSNGQAIPSDRRADDAISNREVRLEQYRACLLDAALDLILTDGMSALRSLLSVSAVHKRAEELGYLVPRASAYRAFSANGPTNHATATDELVREVAEEATTLDRSGVAASNRAMVEAFAAQLGAVDDQSASQDQTEEQLVSVLQALLETTLGNDGLPITWFLNVVAMTASETWHGTKRPSKDNAKLAGKILEINRRYAKARTAELAPLMRTAMSAARRRPRPGMTPETLVKLMNAMFDGAVMRLIIEPDAFDTRMVAEAVLRVGLAFSEPGTYWDPRRPNDTTQAALFDDLVDAARDCWSGGAELTLETVAAEVGSDIASVANLFPTIADFADSVVRSHVMSGGPTADDAKPSEATELAAMLWNLTEAVELFPGAVQLASSYQDQLTASFLHEVRSLVTDLVESSIADGCPTHTAAQTADDVLALALRGHAGWHAIVPVLRLCGLPTETPSASGPQRHRTQQAASSLEGNW